MRPVSGVNLVCNQTELISLLLDGIIWKRSKSTNRKKVSFESQFLEFESIHYCLSSSDYSQGFGGKFGLQKDRMDKCAVGFQDAPDKIGTNYTKVKPEVLGTKPSVLRAKFEDMNIKTEETSKPAVRKQSDKAGDIVGKMQVSEKF